MKKIFFVTGTDTGVGKTTVTCHLLQTLAQQGQRTFAIKPVASGGLIQEGNNIYNEDALQLMQSASIKSDYNIINPILFKHPVSPHLAAELENKTLNAAQIAQACEPGLAIEADTIFIEGAGGWLAPINATETMADVVKHLGCPVILVVGLRLGCLNHALLTYENILQCGVPLAGWVVNEIDPAMLNKQENIAYLQEKIRAPYWGCVKVES